jgi:hypothetical protein
MPQTLHESRDRNARNRAAGISAANRGENYDCAEIRQSLGVCGPADSGTRDEFVSATRAAVAAVRQYAPAVARQLGLVAKRSRSEVLARMHDLLKGN